MAAISFSGETSRGPFYKLILSGEKKQTVRKPRKRPIKEDETLHFYWKQRTPMDQKPIHLIGKSVCTLVERVKKIDFIYDKGFALADGFGSLKEMQEWFGLNDLHEEYDVIHWGLVSARADV
jgi:hypothetical protein